MIQTREFLEEQTGAFSLALLLVFLLAALITIQRDSCQSVQSQKKILTITVLARTDIRPEQAEGLRQQLVRMPSVTKVTAVSPEESLKNLSADPSLKLDAEWLQEKNLQRNGDNTILPWSYSLHLDRWDALSLEQILTQIRNLTVSDDHQPLVTEAGYDPERWKLLVGLEQRLLWLKSILSVSLTLFIFVGVFPLARSFAQRKGPAPVTLIRYLAERRGPLLMLGFLCGTAGAILHQSLRLIAFEEKFTLDKELFLCQWFLATSILAMSAGRLWLEKNVENHG